MNEQIPALQEVDIGFKSRGKALSKSTFLTALAKEAKDGIKLRKALIFTLKNFAPYSGNFRYNSKCRIESENLPPSDMVFLTFVGVSRSFARWQVREGCMVGRLHLQVNSVRVLFGKVWWAEALPSQKHRSAGEARRGDAQSFGKRDEYRRKTRRAYGPLASCERECNNRKFVPATREHVRILSRAS